MTADLRRVCVFCGSSPGGRPEYRRLATDLGRALARRRITLVFGGGHVGLMGELADTVLAEGGEAVGVIPHGLFRKEVAHEALTDLEVVATMHDRKARMAELADAFVALPGGLGTLEELFETWTWAQLGIHDKPFGLLDSDGYYDHLIRFLDHAVEERFVKREHQRMVLVAADPDDLLDRLAAYRPPVLPKWIDSEET